MCAPGATLCSAGTSLRTCDASGHYVSAVACPSGICASGACTACYLQSVTLTNPASGGAQTSFQVRLDISSSNTSFWNHLASGANATGNDLRIRTAADADLSYWIDRLDATARTARIWVKIPAIAAGPSTAALKLYYGNATRSAATNIVSTMVFGDEFDGTGTGTSGAGLDGSSPLLAAEAGDLSARRFFRASKLAPPPEVKHQRAGEGKDGQRGPHAEIG